MATLKHQLNGVGWQLVYAPDQRELYVETGAQGRLGIDEALQAKGPGADELHLLIVDIFRGPV